MKKYKLVLYDEVNSVWLLKKHVWWVFYSVVNAGSKETLTQWVKDTNGVLI